LFESLSGGTPARQPIIRTSLYCNAAMGLEAASVAAEQPLEEVPNGMKNIAC
jgi:hypothetical protein